ncbi:hypothetical protein ATY79_25700 [Rhizobium sp. R693]|nr:hypothetical protein ATY79_25700 [Rhizobium sp. R693]
MHEADEPNTVVDFLDAEFLSGQHGGDIELFAIDADAAAIGHQRIPIMEGVVDHLHAERFVRPLLIEFADESIEAGLLLQDVFARVVWSPLSSASGACAHAGRFVGDGPA